MTPAEREELRKLDTETRLRLRAALTKIITEVRSGTLNGDIRDVGQILCGEWDQDFPMALFEGSLALLDALDAAEGEVERLKDVLREIDRLDFGIVGKFARSALAPG